MILIVRLIIMCSEFHYCNCEIVICFVNQLRAMPICEIVTCFALHIAYIALHQAAEVESTSSSAASSPSQKPVVIAPKPKPPQPPTQVVAAKPKPPQLSKMAVATHPKKPPPPPAKSKAYFSNSAQ